jgi:Hok/gef family.
MKRNKVVIAALVVLCITVVISILVTRKDLCAVRIRSEHMEVAVFTAYESVK